MRITAGLTTVLQCSVARLCSEARLGSGWGQPAVLEVVFLGELVELTTLELMAILRHNDLRNAVGGEDQATLVDDPRGRHGV